MAKELVKAGPSAESLPPGSWMKLLVERQEQGVRVEGLGQKAGHVNFTQLGYFVVAVIVAVHRRCD